MAEFTNLRVSFSREKQPKDYEKAVPTAEMSATLDTDDDPLEVGLDAMHKVCTIVYAGLGYEVPERVEAMLTGGEVPEGGKVETTNNKAEGEPDKPKRKRRTKKEIEADNKKAAEAALAAEAAKKADASEIPDGGGEDRQISKDPENRQGPDDASSEIPDEGAEPAKAAEPKADASDIPDEGGDSSGDEDMTAADLQGFLTKKVADKKITVPQVKAILANHNVARVTDLPADKVLVVKAEIELECS